MSARTAAAAHNLRNSSAVAFRRESPDCKHAEDVVVAAMRSVWLKLCATSWGSRNRWRGATIGRSCHREASEVRMVQIEWRGNVLRMDEVFIHDIRGTQSGVALRSPHNRGAWRH